MAVTKRPPIRREVSEAELEALINRAPDAPRPIAPVAVAPALAPTPAPAPAPAPTPVRAVAPASSRKQGISLTLPPELIVRIDETAHRLNLSRAAAIALACTKWVDAEKRGA
ncbi:hypothetical protein [Burkholderia vietnamiensis]|uniref:hypothetical protein n=1 Tax=Burkholderia vietnamiensis TaxID=60552 RepID=UPI001B9D8AB5|nr:hypothetical protein [Burkholderia vietnamiensis]MBR8055640.1 hypothetical protein [Burkholderia vietnamiensis]